MQNTARFYAFLVGRSQKWNPMAFETMDIDQVGQSNNNLNNMIQQLFREQQHSSRWGRWPNTIRDNGQRMAGKERQGTNKQHWQHHKPTTESDTKEDSDVIVMCYRCPHLVLCLRWFLKVGTFRALCSECVPSHSFRSRNRQVAETNIILISWAGDKESGTS